MRDETWFVRADVSGGARARRPPGRPRAGPGGGGGGTLDRIGDKWSLLVIALLDRRKLRFTELKRTPSGTRREGSRQQPPLRFVKIGQDSSPGPVRGLRAQVDSCRWLGTVCDQDRPQRVAEAVVVAARSDGRADVRAESCRQRGWSGWADD